MRLLPICIALLALVAGCGQKGPLVRPDRISTPVVIRSPAPAAPAAAPPGSRTEDDKDAPQRR